MKTYVKPELFYERYELSQYIASCAARWWFDKDQCSLTVSGASAYFAGTTVGCETKVLDSEFELYCYMNSEANGLPTFDS